jgi:hypothetical protein
MKMSSRRAALKGGPVTQHCPQNIDPPTRQRDESLGVPLALGPLAIIEGSGFWSTTQEAGKSPLVEHPLDLSLVASSLRKRWLPTRLPESLVAGTNPA